MNGTKGEKMKALLTQSIVALTLLSQAIALAKPTTISDIVDENIICVNISTLKKDGYAFKTTPPYKIWKAQLDQEGKIKTKKTFLLGNSEMIKDPEESFLKGFSAELAQKQKLAGTFNRQMDEDFTLTVITSHEDDKSSDGKESKGNIVSRYNCQLSSH